MNFASDNTVGVCPEVMAALQHEAEGSDLAYGDDAASARLVDALAEVFEHEVAVYPVTTGTAANALALAASSPPWGAVLCHQDAHIVVDELGAPTVFGGGLTLVPLPGGHGRLDPAQVEAVFRRTDHGVHTTPLTALSLTQTTEAGTRYHADDVAALCEVAARHDLVVHMDGARFANAVAGAGASPAELTWRAGVDVLSLGATKGGAMVAEAVVVFRPDRLGDLARHRKRQGHLVSKQRFVAAQLLGWLSDGAWLRHADHANALAARLGEGLERAGLTPLHPVEANMVFVSLEQHQVEALGRAGAFFYTRPRDDGREEARFVTSWATTVDEVDALVAAAEQLPR